MQEFTSKEYLKIDIANNFGLDKEDWNVRIQWTNDNEHQLDSLIPEAKKPALFYAGIKALRAAQNGEEIGYPISLDASASGMQILSCLAGDSLAASICNVVDVGGYRNAYMEAYKSMCAIVGTDTTIQYDHVKKAIMTLE